MQPLDRRARRGRPARRRERSFHRIDRSSINSSHVPVRERRGNRRRATPWRRRRPFRPMMRRARPGRRGRRWKIARWCASARRRRVGRSARIIGRWWTPSSWRFDVWGACGGEPGARARICRRAWASGSVSPVSERAARRANAFP